MGVAALVKPLHHTVHLTGDSNTVHHVLNLVCPVDHELHLLALDGKDPGVHDNHFFGQKDERLLLHNVLLCEPGELLVKMFVDCVDLVH
jgi:hypothetical protein